MKLYVMRHGPAEDNASTGRDEDRALTERGRERVRHVAQLLAREGELPERILASGLVRARTTAEIVAAVAAREPHRWAGTTELAQELAPGGQSFDLVRRLERAAAKAPMVVGHEPDLSSLVERLLEEPLGMAMDKAMVVALDPGAPPGARLRFIVEPRSLSVVHDKRG